MLKLNKDTNPLDQISDLIEVLDQCLGQDYLIAGGFVRDWYQDEPFNDIDIYLFRDTEVKEKLFKTKRFSFSKVADLFLDTVFHEQGSFFTKGRPKYNVQFISWYKGPKDVLDSFDFEHCKFFIPMNYLKAKHTTSDHFKAFIPRIPYAYDKAVETLKKKELRFSNNSKEKLLDINSHAHGIAILEKHVKRTKKFKERGFLVPDEVKTILLNSTESFLKKNTPAKTGRSRSKSILLEDADYAHAIGEGSKYTEAQIASNLIKELISLYDESERAIFFISPVPLIRDTAKEFMEREAV